MMANTDEACDCPFCTGAKPLQDAHQKVVGWNRVAQHMALAVMLMCALILVAVAVDSTRLTLAASVMQSVALVGSLVASARAAKWKARAAALAEALRGKITAEMRGGPCGPTAS